MRVHLLPIFSKQKGLTLCTFNSPEQKRKKTSQPLLIMFIKLPTSRLSLLLSLDPNPNPKPSYHQPKMVPEDVDNVVNNFRKI